MNRTLGAAVAVVLVASAALALAGVGLVRMGGPVHAIVPPGVASTAVPEGDGDVAGACGKERWAVKTGTDDDAAAVATAPVDSTVAALRALPAPSQTELDSHPTQRIAPVETTVYRVSATLVEYKRETDSDFHLVIADAAGRTMIAEIPAPSCTFGGPFRAAIGQARTAFDGRFPGAERQISFRNAGVPVTLTGAGFFDFQHGQTGVAPNAIELHPVLAIAFG